MAKIDKIKVDNIEYDIGADYSNIDNKPNLSTVATSGSYNDLSDKPTIPDVSNFITKDVNNLTYYTLATETGSTIELSINSSTYVMTMNLKNSAGTTISTQNVDLPLESVVVSGSYDSTNKKIILTLQNGNTIDIPVADLVSGLQSEITSSNKLSSDLVDDTISTNKFVTSAEKTTWNAKYDKPSGGIPSTDMASAVQTSLGKADTAVQNTDYATNSTGGVVKSSSNYGVYVSKDGIIMGQGKDYSQYQSLGNNLLISKGTLENAITGKGLVSNTNYATSSTGGVIKTSASFLLNDGAPYAREFDYATYNTIQGIHFISKTTLENVIAGKGLVLQYSTMPTASADNLGKIVQYIGADTVDYTNGYWYKCIEESNVYSWEEIAGGSASVDIDNSTITKNASDQIQTVGVKDQKTTNTNKFWTGTLTEYNALVNNNQIDSNTFYHITDDTSADNLRENVEVITSADTSYTIANLTGNKSYKLGELTALTITACETFDEETIIYFTSGTTATVLTMPNDVTQLGDTTINASKSYIIAVLNKIAVIKEY